MPNEPKLRSSLSWTSHVLPTSVAGERGRGGRNCRVANGGAAGARGVRFGRRERLRARSESGRRGTVANCGVGNSPNGFGPILVLTTLTLGGAVLESAGLALLGLSGQPDVAEWGAMLREERSAFRVAPWLCIVPGVAIAWTVLALTSSATACVSAGGELGLPRIRFGVVAVFWKGARVVERAGLENRYGPMVHRGFESLPFRQLIQLGVVRDRES